MFVIGASPSGKAAGFDPAIRWFESSRPCHYRSSNLGASPSGKAAGFDPAIRWFESSRPCHFSLFVRLVLYRYLINHIDKII
jgi:hypothetical protein